MIPAVPTKKSALLPILVLAGFLFLQLVPAPAQAAADPKEEAKILDAAEALFLNMAKRDLPALWKGLSSESRRAIARNVQKAVVKTGAAISDEEVAADLESGGRLAREYWGGYLSRFDPKLILDESRWSIGEVQQERAELLIRHRKSDYDAHLKMTREGGAWKVGLDETFSTRQ